MQQTYVEPSQSEHGELVDKYERVSARVCCSSIERRRSETFLGCSLCLLFASVWTPLVNAINVSFPHLDQYSLVSKNQWRHVASRELQAYASNIITPATHVRNCQRADARWMRVFIAIVRSIRQLWGVQTLEMFRCLWVRCWRIVGPLSEKSEFSTTVEIY